MSNVVTPASLSIKKFLPFLCLKCGQKKFAAVVDNCQVKNILIRTFDSIIHTGPIIIAPLSAAAAAADDDVVP